MKAGDGGDILMVCLYVDDLVFTSNNAGLVESFKKSIMKEFEMSDLGLMSYFLGVEVVQRSDGIFISQRKYVADILKKFKMDMCNPTKTPVEVGTKLTKKGEGPLVDPTLFKQIVGSLRYLTCTRPDISYGVGLISRFMESPNQSHMKVARRIMRYLKGTQDFGLFYDSTDNCALLGYSDSDWAGDLDDRKSTTGSCFTLGSAACSWVSRKQPTVALSTCEAEYMAAATSACQALWLASLLSEMHIPLKGNLKIYVDNKSAINLAKNPVAHGRSKHIDIKWHFLRELVEQKKIELVFCKSENQVADIMTKPLKLDAFVKLRSRLGICPIESVVRGNVGQ